MPFQMRKKGHHKEPDPPATAVVQEPVVEQETAAVVVEGQSAADPTVELTPANSFEIVSTPTAEETVSATVDQETTQDTGTVPDTASESQAIGPIEQEVVAPVLIETCESVVVGPPEAVAAALAAAVPSTALAVVKQEETAVVKKPVISERTRKTWGRSVKDPEKKANLLLPDSPDFAGDLVITKLVDNPKLPNKSPWLRFAKYRSGMTVAEYVKACERLTTAKVSQADLKWDVNHGYIRVSVAAEGAPQLAKVEEKAA